MTALSAQGDLEGVEGGHHRAIAERHFAKRDPRPVMQRVDGVHREALEQPLFHHFARAAEVLFRRLENKVDGAAELTGLRQMGGGRQQHRGVAIVAAGVHDPGAARTVADAPQLGDRQGVHIGAQADNRPGAVLQRRHDAGAGQPAMHLQPKRGQQLRNAARGLLLLISELRRGVKFTSPANGFGDQ